MTVITTLYSGKEIASNLLAMIFHNQHFLFAGFADELFKVHKLKPSPQWRQQFEKYLKSMPGYYAGVSDITCSAGICW